MPNQGRRGLWPAFAAWFIDKKSQHPIFCRQFCDNTRLL